MVFKFIKAFLCAGMILGVAHARVYTLDEIISEALKNSKAIKSIEEEIRKAEAQVQQTIGTAMPSLSFSMNLNHAFKTTNPFSSTATDQTINPEFFQYLYANEDAATRQVGPKVTEVTLNALSEMLNSLGDMPPNSAVVGLSVKQPLYAQGKVWLGLKVARTSQRTLLCKLQGEKLKVKASVTKLFYGALLGKKNLELKIESVNLAKETHRLTVIQLETGSVSALDTLTSRLHLKNALIQQRKAESDQKISFETLMTGTGIKDTIFSFDIEGTFPEPEFSLTIDEAINGMMDENAQISQMKGLMELQNLLVKLAKTDFKPVIYAGASVSRVNQFESIGKLDLFKWGDDRSVFAGLSWDIFTGLQRLYKLKQAESERELYILGEKQIRDNLDLAIRNAYEKVITSKDEISSTQEVIALAEKGFEISKEAYEVGGKTFLDVRNAEHELNNAKMMSLAALYTFHIALIDLKLLMGTL